MELDPKKYKKEVAWSEEDQVFVARAPQIPGCMSHGDSDVEALKNLDQVIVLCLEGLAELELEKADGVSKFLLRMPANVKAVLVKLSNDRDSSINDLILEFIDEGIEFATAKEVGSLKELFSSKTAAFVKSKKKAKKSSLTAEEKLTKAVFGRLAVKHKKTGRIQAPKHSHLSTRKRA